MQGIYLATREYGWLQGIYLATREYGWLQGIYLATREYGWLQGIYLATREYGWLQGIYLATREYNCRVPVWLPGDIFVIRKYDYGNLSSYQGSMAVVDPGCQVIWQQEIYFTTGE